MLEKTWPEAAKLVLAAVATAEAEGKDWTHFLLNEASLAAFDVPESDLTEAVVELLVDAEVEEAVAEALACDGLLDHLKSLRRDGQVRPYWQTRDTKGLGAAKHLLFYQLVRFLDLTGFRGAYLFVDDIENLTDQMANKHAIEFAKELGLALLRPGRAAGDRRFFTAILTAHQQAATKLARGWGEAGLQAVARLDPTAPTSIRVPLPTEDGALEMMAAYIGRHRSPGPKVERLHPFTVAGARRLVSGVQPPLHPRTFLQKAHFILKQAVEEKLEVIDAKDVERMFADVGVRSTGPSASDIEEYPAY